MAYIKEIEIDNTVYDIKDAEARTTIAALENAFSGSGSYFNNLIDVLYPVGSIYISVNNSAPFSRGTWSKIGSGKALVGVDPNSSVDELKTAGNTFGSANAINVSHTHTTTSHHHTVTSHTHGPGTLTGYVQMRASDDGSSTVRGPKSYQYSSFDRVSSDGSVVLNGGATGAASPTTNGASVSVSASGSSGTNKNYQPSISVYIWKRTA